MFTGASGDAHGSLLVSADQCLTRPQRQLHLTDKQEIDFFVWGLNPTQHRADKMNKHTVDALQDCRGFYCETAAFCGASLAATSGCYHNCHHSYQNHSEILFNKSSGIHIKEIQVTATCAQYK